MTLVHHSLVGRGPTRRAATRHTVLDRTCALLGALVAVVVTALPTAGVLMAVVAALGGSISYAGALPVGLLAGLLPLAVAVGLAERP